VTPERWLQIDELLNQARERPVGDRPEVLDLACGDDRELRHEVESLLAFDDHTAFLDGAAFSVHAADPDIGRSIGHYELVRLLGRGGMGAVYLAARQDDYRRQVALKLIKRGMDSDEIIRRFQNERQILADLDHPNIARLLDGGTTEDGRPYFVMEYIEGEPIDRYCDHHRLPTKERLLLFRQVCSAVQVSHQNLVVHRDLKPGNILVTKDGGVPKLLDFGIAKMVVPESAAQALETIPGQRPMTLKYSSPEQARGEAVTTASDTYSLGVLLYELLTGHHPTELEDLETPSDEEIVRRIRQRDPPRPSTAIRRQREIRQADGKVVRLTPESVSRTRDGDPRKLRRRLAGDLDAIVLKALRKESSRRYGSVERFSEDIRRYLVGLPVTARQGTFTYRTGKFVRRNGWALAVLLLILGFSAATTVLWRRATGERDRAVKEQQRADSAFQLVKDLIIASDPSRSEFQLTREILKRAKQLLDEAQDDNPQQWADLVSILGTVHRNLGLYDEARELMEGALESQRRRYSGDHPLLAEKINNLAALYFDIGDNENAERLFREALAMRYRLGQENAIESVKTMNNLASSLMSRGEPAESLRLYRQGLKIRQQYHGPMHPDVATSLRNLANLQYFLGDAEGAESLLLRALKIRLEHYQRRDLRVASVLDKLGSVRQALGDSGEAETLFTEALDIQRQLLGEDHPTVAWTQMNLVALLLAREDASPEELATVAVLLTQARQTLVVKKPPSDWQVARVESLFGAYLMRRGRYQEAEPCLVDGYRVLEEKHGAEAVYSRAAGERRDELYAVRDEARRGG